LKSDGVAPNLDANCPECGRLQRSRKELMIMRKILAGTSLAMCGSVLLATAACGPNTPQTSGDAAVVRIEGSDTMVNLAQAWAEAYGKVRPEVSVQVSGGGSGVGIASLIEGVVDMAAASR